MALKEKELIMTFTHTGPNMDGSPGESTRYEFEPIKHVSRRMTALLESVHPRLAPKRNGEVFKLDKATHTQEGDWVTLVLEYELRDEKHPVYIRVQESK